MNSLKRLALAVVPLFVIVVLLPTTTASAESGSFSESVPRIITEPKTGAVLKVWNEGNCQNFRMEENIPGGDGLDKNIVYTVDSNCFVALDSGQTKLAPVTAPRAGKASTKCRNTFTTQEIKDPVNLTVSRLDMNGTRCWNGSTSYFSAPRSAKANTYLWWNWVTKPAYFTSCGDSFGRTATLSASAGFRTKWVECGVVSGRPFSMTNRITTNANGRYSTGFSHNLSCGAFIKVQTNHYER